MRPTKVVAIDGPSGSGKSTIAKRLADALGVLYIDTGAMYRALAYACDEQGIPFVEGEQLRHFLERLELRYGIGPGRLIEVNGQNLTEKIREHRVSELASYLSQLPTVRAYLVDFQRQLAQEKICVMEGRDIGTVVFPDAFCKFFITASVEIRAKRRLEQLRLAGDQQVALKQVIVDVEKRDATDMARAHSPLKRSEDALLIDTSDLTLDEIIEQLKDLVRGRAEQVGLNL